MTETTSDTTPSVWQRIANLQREAPILGKNSDGYNYKYTTLDSMWKTILPLMEEHGLAWSCVSSMDMAGGAEDGMGGQLVETMTVKVYSTDNPSDSVQNTYMFPAVNPQKVGSYETYYRRYALTKILGVVSGDDDDGAKASESNNPPAPTVNF